MAGENVELVRRLFDAFNAGTDADSYEEYWTEETEVWPASGFPEGGPFKGPEQGRRFLEGLREGWGPGMQVTIGSIEGAGDAVVAEFEWRGVGEASGIETSSNWWVVYVIREGKIRSIRYFNDGTEARRAAGLG